MDTMRSLYQAVEEETEPRAPSSAPPSSRSGHSAGWNEDSGAGWGSGLAMSLKTVKAMDTVKPGQQPSIMPTDHLDTSMVGVAGSVYGNESEVSVRTTQSDLPTAHTAEDGRFKHQEKLMRTAVGTRGASNQAPGFFEETLGSALGAPKHPAAGEVVSPYNVHRPTKRLQNATKGLPPVT
eukprot:NODE_6502_length_635_cov_69.125984_g6479_i0.p1 GENE.NODE_6502_length_635_cov_69.125984_g6479_i0~~NODE_6502_length_635_cov_69.125984_g6479_i0.p1  ORF type:complete len:201 (+),score=38.16 NODE_6502_length_635_cov_69.125984_g6479_i0:64-603(+)